jgi:hypothetical protein
LQSSQPGDMPLYFDIFVLIFSTYRSDAMFQKGQETLVNYVGGIQMTSFNFISAFTPIYIVERSNVISVYVKE